MVQSEVQRTESGRAEPDRALDEIEFVDHGGTYLGKGNGGRAWRISATFTGWRLEFRDPGDVRPTYAGTHASLPAAQREANWEHQPGSRSLPRQRDV